MVHYEDLPPAELAPGSMSHLVVGEQAMVSFLTIPVNTKIPVHRHEAEQVMIVLEGYFDQAIDGKLYRLEKGDVVVLRSNVPDVGEVECRVIDIFAPPRVDLAAKAREAYDKMGR